MSLAVLHSRALAGLDAPLVTVEVHLANGLPSFTIVGLPEAEVRESRDRVRAALANCRFEFPTRRLTGNLAPAGSGRFFGLPRESPGGAGLVVGARILAADSLLEVCAHLLGTTLLSAPARDFRAAVSAYPDLNEVKGQTHVKRALEVAAAGRH